MEGEFELPVMETVTCLEFDSRLYDHTKVVRDGSLVFGNGRAYTLIKALAGYAGRSHGVMFREMEHRGEVGPDRPLPALEPLVA
jgi:hypothetical protein